MNEKDLLSYVLCNTIILRLNIVFYCEKMIVYSLWSRDPDSSKQKVKTIDFQTICLSIDYDSKDGIKSSNFWLTSLKSCIRPWIPLNICLAVPVFRIASQRTLRFEFLQTCSEHNLKKNWKYILLKFLFNY